MFCGKCGSKIPDGTQYCPKCGKIQENRNASVVLNTDGNEDNYLHIQSNKSNKLPSINTNAKSSILSKFISIFLCILLFAFLVSAITVSSVRTVFNRENLRNICTKIDASEINLEYKDDSVNITDFIMKTVSNEILEKYNISCETINNLLLNDTIKENLEDIGSEYLCYIIYGDESKNLSVTGILDIIKSCSDIVYSETGYAFTDNDYRDIERELIEGNMKFLVSENIKNNSVINISLINALFSLPSLIIHIVIIIGLILLLLWCNKWKLKYLCSYFGMTLTIVGIIYLLIAISSFIISLFSRIYLLKIFLQSIMLCIFLFGIGSFAIGFIMFLLYRKIFKNKSL